MVSTVTDVGPIVGSTNPAWGEASEAGETRSLFITCFEYNGTKQTRLGDFFGSVLLGMGVHVGIHAT